MLKKSDTIFMNEKRNDISSENLSPDTARNSGNPPERPEFKIKSSSLTDVFMPNAAILDALNTLPQNDIIEYTGDKSPSSFQNSADSYYFLI